ncbi:hypothetical protein C4K38_3709 [Pseudomonas chlororaphis subsp. piscium]|nr:hypothetical protein C4K38_3709 [Pseudomonas chlororaphis subsp. piscium]SDS85791.1 hypothetical protein SAMN05216585_3675 [Pseudomonas chlororaphis]
MRHGQPKLAATDKLSALDMQDWSNFSEDPVNNGLYGSQFSHMYHLHF